MVLLGWTWRVGVEVAVEEGRVGVREEVGTRGLDLMIWEGVCVDNGVCRPGVDEVTRVEVVGLTVEVK